MPQFKNLPLPPQDRDEILSTVGLQRSRIYRTIRKILDDFEVVARWEQLYYPPTEIEEFLRIQSNLVSLIEEIPYRISEMTVGILADAYRDLVSGLPTAILDDETREMILGLLEPAKARAATPSTRKIAFEIVDSLPRDVFNDSQKLLFKWLIDRHAAEPTVELSGEAFEASIASFPSDVIDDSMKEILSNVQFYFDGIHEMVSGDLEKLRGRIEFFGTAEAAQLSAQERVFTCEISADLKGKYTSAIMGAASNLVSEGIWNGAEVEPILFHEKEEEFTRNEQLVATLKEVLQSIRRLPEDVPLVEIVDSWKQSRRIDRYALSHLYGFLSSLGKLMKESSRRALYSGDYHQVQLREHRLSNRINELNMLHTKTWEVLDETDPGIVDLYPQMVDKAVELAAVVDVEILKQLVGEEIVRSVLEVVSLEGEKRKEIGAKPGQESAAACQTPQSAASRAKIPERWQGLVDLLCDEDLQTFLELLIGSVLKRASFTVKQRREKAESGEYAAFTKEAPEAEPAESVPEESVFFEDLSVLDVEVLPEAGGSDSASAETSSDEGRRERQEALEKLRDCLQDLSSPANPQRRSFNLVQQLLNRKGVIPPTMMQSIQPFLETLTESVVPELAAVAAQGDIPITYQSELTQYCRELSRRDLSSMDLKTGVLTRMEGLLSLLGDVEAAILEAIDHYGSSSGGSDDFPGSDEGFLGTIE